MKSPKTNLINIIYFHIKKNGSSLLGAMRGPSILGWLLVMDASKNGDPLMLGSMSLNSPKGFLFVPVTTAIIYALSEHICVFQSVLSIWGTSSLSCLPVNTVGFKTSSNAFPQALMDVSLCWCCILWQWTSPHSHYRDVFLLQYRVLDLPIQCLNQTKVHFTQLNGEGFQFQLFC